MRYLALVLDDQPSEVRLLENVLKARGFDVVSASNSTKATELLHRVCPHLLLVDIMLGPNENGLKWLQEVRVGAFKRVPAIIMTSSNAKQDIQTALAMGISDYIMKPADFNLLNKKLFAMAKKLEAGSPYGFKISGNQEVQANLQADAQISAVSEVGIAVSSFISNATPTSSPKLTTDIFQKMGVNPPQEMIWVNRESEVNRKRLGTPFRVYCQAKGWVEDQRMQVRDWIAKEKLKRAF